MPFSNTGGLVGPTASASSSGALRCAPPVEHRVFSRSSFIDQLFVPTMLCIPFSISEFPESTFQITRLYVYGGLLQDREPCTGNRLRVLIYTNLFNCFRRLLPGIHYVS
jgi:hypothetical protein